MLFLSCLCYIFVRVCLLMAGKGMTCCLSFVMSNLKVSISNWYPLSGVVLDCIDS